MDNAVATETEADADRASCCLLEAIYKAVPNAAYRDLALRMARSTRRAADYMLQAPILVSGATYGRDYKAPRERVAIVGLFAQRCRLGPKLRDLMAQYGIAYGFRALRGVAIAPSKEGAIFAISRLEDLHPSTLAQAIPSSPMEQAIWLSVILSWITRLDARRHNGAYALGWVLKISAQVTERGFSLEDLADFYFASGQLNGPYFDLRWSSSEAVAAMERWHATLIHLTDVDIDAPSVDYAPLPNRMEVGGFTFVALTTARALREEGRAMRHCVGSYHRDVVEGRSRIYSIRSGDKRRATIEFKPIEFKGKPLSFVLWQLKGYANRGAHLEILRAAKLFEQSVNRELSHAPVALLKDGVS